MANGTSLILLISRRKKRTTKRATIKALINPAIKKGNRSALKYAQFLIKESRLAPIMIGIAMMKVKSAAALWLKPRITPPEIVEPEREKPGQSARH